ncbi:zf-HC2 domain-containing protein [Streptomyces rimosus]|uniref:zf-HC2 domain-containing protein n=1 Tax=Streptomyces rimosus TaxID=1927 RepID=UPI00099D6785|nr:zf-HC2 domain-containing protein [Streptomyces rimosus]
MTLHNPTPGPSFLQGRLAALLDGELGRDARERVLAHLEDCVTCNPDRLWQVFDGGLIGLPEPLDQRRRELDVTSLTDGSITALGSEQQYREPQAERCASLAARIAGERRNLRTAWLSDLNGDLEAGISLTPWQQRRYGLGVLVAAVRCRLRDGLGRLWRPVDWVLASRSRREAVIGAPPASLVIYIAWQDGVHTLLTEGWGWVGGCGVATFAFVRWLERVRGIELADRSSTDDE